MAEHDYNQCELTDCAMCDAHDAGREAATEDLMLEQMSLLNSHLADIATSSDEMNQKLGDIASR